MLHSPLANEYLSIFLKVINYSSASWFPVLTWPLLTEKYILSCHLFLPIMVVVRQFPAASSLTVLNPGEYTARSGADILRISVKLIKNWSFFLGMRLLQSTLTGFVTKENMSIVYSLKHHSGVMMWPGGWLVHSLFSQCRFEMRQIVSKINFCLTCRQALLCWSQGCVLSKMR